jgi:hypothetical protein
MTQRKTLMAIMRYQKHLLLVGCGEDGWRTSIMTDEKRTKVYLPLRHTLVKTCGIDEN